MAILDFLSTTLCEFFAGTFTRFAGYQVFIIVIMGFLTRYDSLGCTSFVRSLGLHPSRYGALIHFFRSKSYSLDDVRKRWYACVADRAKAYLVTVGDTTCPLLIGDGVQQKHSGERMTAVLKLAKYGDTSVVVRYFFGHQRGAIGVAISNGVQSFCTPLLMDIEAGLAEMASWLDPDRHVDEAVRGRVEPRLVSQTVKMIQNAAGICSVIGRSFLVLDRFYLTVPMLTALKAVNTEAVILSVITRAKMGTTAYELPPERLPGTRGRPRKKGDAVKLRDLFADLTEFTTATVNMYGEQTEIRYLVKDLLWGPKLYQLLRFVLVVRPDGSQAIFVSTDITLSATAIVEAYCHRFKIELCFRSLKQVFAGLMGRFWTRVQPKLDRYHKKGTPTGLESITDTREQERILDVLEAYERYTGFACIAEGLAQMIALNPEHARTVSRYRWLRTSREGRVSEATVVYYLASKLNGLMRLSPKCAITQIIRNYQRPARGARADRGAA